MIRSFIIHKYIIKEFSKVIINFLLIFFSLGYIMNLFEEINFFKDINIDVHIPIFLSLLKVPSLIYEMFPFIMLLSGIWFFLKIKKSREVTAMKISGMSNFTVMLMPGILTILIGIFFVTSLNPVASMLMKKYEASKGSFEEDKAYLAAITENGIWIREKGLKKNNIIKSTHLKENHLMNITIYEFDEDNNFTRRIEAKSGDISSVNWILKEVDILNDKGKIIFQNLEQTSYESLYDIQSIKSLYSNLNTISFWNIKNEIKLLEQRGYSTIEMRTKLQKSLSFPFYLLAMVLLSAVFTLGTTFRENNFTYVILAITSCVIIYFFNDFSAALGKTDKLSVMAAVWMPILIIYIFSSVGVIYANQK